MNEPKRETEITGLLTIQLEEVRKKDNIPNESSVVDTLRDTFTTINTLTGIIEKQQTITDNQITNITNHFNSIAKIVAYYDDFPSEETRKRISDRFFKQKEGLYTRINDLLKTINKLFEHTQENEKIKKFKDKVELTIKLIDIVR